jgi:hypothetical protein
MRDSDDQSMAEQLPDSIGTYRIASCLGPGGMGEVFLGEKQLQHQQDLIRRLAIASTRLAG